MRVALLTTFAASRKEPLADMIGRVHAAFLAAGFGEPCVRFTLIDAPGSAEGSAIAALTDRSFVPAIEAISGPSPEWFQPDTA